MVKRGTRCYRDMRRERGTGGGWGVVVGQNVWPGEGGWGWIGVGSARDGRCWWWWDGPEPQGRKLGQEEVHVTVAARECV